MKTAKYLKAALMGIAIAAVQSTALAAPPPPPTVPAIFFTTGGLPPMDVPKLLDSGNGSHKGTFTPDGGPDSILDVTGSNSVYIPGYVTSINNGGGDASDYLAIGGFSPSTDNIYVALKLDNDGTYIDPNSALIQTIIGDINSNASNPNYSGPLASTVGPPFDHVFAGYDILLSFPETFSPGGARPVAGGGPEQFDVGFDFVGYTDTGVMGSGITVTDIGVVPEPASLGVLAIASFLLLPRYRRSRA